MILYGLHTSEGYGRKRLLRYAKTIKNLIDYYEGKYEEYALDAMRMHLKEKVGIDVYKLQEEVEKFEREEENSDKG